MTPTSHSQASWRRLSHRLVSSEVQPVLDDNVAMLTRTTVPVVSFLVAALLILNTGNAAGAAGLRESGSRRQLKVCATVPYIRSHGFAL